MTPAPPEGYRKLPGTRRGFVHRSSVWMGGDHLLLANSVRFREDYKRFYFRDIQAIVVGSAPRAAVSTRAFAAGLAWLAGYLAMRDRVPYGDAVFWGAALALAGAWLYVATARSCRCRIYTAVSRDELPSVYRTWIARRFLEQVEPLIGRAQGVVEGNWAEAAETVQPGPAPAKPPAAPSSPELPAAPVRPAAPIRTTASDIFVATLFAAALLDALTLRSAARAVQWAAWALAFVQVAAAVAVFIEYRRGLVRAAMQRLAVVTLIAMGIAFYLKQIVATLASGSRLMPDLSLLIQQPGYLLLREIGAGVWLVLALAGAAIPLLARDGNE